MCVAIPMAKLHSCVQLQGTPYHSWNVHLSAFPQYAFYWAFSSNFPHFCSFRVPHFTDGASGRPASARKLLGVDKPSQIGPATAVITAVAAQRRWPLLRPRVHNSRCHDRQRNANRRCCWKSSVAKATSRDLPVERINQSLPLCEYTVPWHCWLGLCSVRHSPICDL